MAETTGTPAATSDTNTAPADQAKPAADAAANEAATKAAEVKKAEEKRKLKLKVFGKEEEWDEENVVRFAQKGRAYEQKMQEYAKAEKAKAAMEAEYAKNPRAALEKAMGSENLRKIAIEMIKEEIADRQDPKSAEVRKMQRELDALREETKRAKEKEESDAVEREATQWRQVYDEEFTKALSETKLKKSPFVMRRMAELELKNRKEKLGLPLARIAKLVEEEFVGHIVEYGKSLDGEGFAKTFGEDVEEKISQYRLAKLKAPTPSTKKEDAKEEPKKKSGHETMDLEDWRAEVRRRTGRE